MGTSRTSQIARRGSRGPTCTIEAVERRVLMSGTVVDDYLAPNLKASGEDIVEDAAGNLYVAGGTIDAAGGHYAQVRQGTRQADGSIAWSDTPVVNYTLTPSTTLNGPQSTFYDLVIDQASGDLYAAGQVLDFPNGGSSWLVMKRSAADGSVTVLDHYRQPDGGSAWANGITIDAAGNLFVIGGASSHWVVRHLKPGAGSWETVQDIPPGASSWSNGQDIVAAPSGVYAVGASDGVWVTQCAVPDATGAVTWTTVDAYKADPNYGAMAYGLGADAAGNVYVTGTARRSTGVKQKGQTGSVGEWTVRRTTNGGGTWATVDRFAISSAGGVNYAADFGTDPAGNLYVCGYGRGTEGADQAVVRWARPDGDTWETLDAWQMYAGQSTSAQGILADHTGTLYTVGHAQEELVSARRWDWRNYALHAVVRRIDPPAGVSTTFGDTTITDTSSAQDEETATVGELVLA